MAHSQWQRGSSATWNAGAGQTLGPTRPQSRPRQRIAGGCAAADHAWWAPHRGAKTRVESCHGRNGCSRRNKKRHVEDEVISDRVRFHSPRGPRSFQRRCVEFRFNVFKASSFRKVWILCSPTSRRAKQQLDKDRRFDLRQEHSHQRQPSCRRLRRLL